MCVVAVAATERPTPEMVAKMFADNPHGAGIAWREEEKKGKGFQVVWKKGLEEPEVQELVAKLPLPFVVHFRVPSCGGPSELLTHPFPIQKDVPLALEGTTKGHVLFHNGHWHQYKERMLEASIRGNNHVPTGRWSDSRAMAWMAAHYGIGMLEFINEKVVVFGPEKGDIELFGENGWSKVGTGIWVSNKGWEHRQVKGFNQAAFSPAKKDDKVAAESDKEEPPKGAKKDMADRADRSGGQEILTSGETDKKGGAHLKGRPFEVYMTAMRLWKKMDISNNAFKKERRKYETWCYKNKTQPLPRPQRWERGERIH